MTILEVGRDGDGEVLFGVRAITTKTGGNGVGIPLTFWSDNWERGTQR